MKNLKLVLFALVLLALTACSSGDAGKTDGGIKPDATSGEAATEAATLERPPVPEGTDYGGFEFRVLIPEAYLGGLGDGTFAEVYSGEENGEPLNDAIYKRNSIVEDLLNIKIKTVVSTSWHTMPNSIKKSVQAGDDDFDAIDGAYQPAIAYAGCLANLYKVQNMDLAKPWWDQRMIETLSYKKSKLYYISGDIGYYDKYGIACILFNKRLFADNGLDYPYEKVRSGAWTLDEFAALIKNAGRDLNGDGKMDENDLWGLTENSGASLRMLLGCGERIIELDGDGMPYLGAISERHIKAVMAIGELLSDKNNVLIGDSGQLKHFADCYAAMDAVSKNGQALFMGGQIVSIPSFREMEDDFGVIPFPKFDKSQPNYHAWVVSYGNGSAYSIPVTNTDLSRTGMIFEVMCGYSTDIIIPALIDVSLNSKFTRDEESAEMLGLIFKSKIYDFAVEYGWGGIVWQNLYANVYSQLTLKGADKFVSSIEKETAKAEEQMEKFINAFDEMD